MNRSIFLFSQIKDKLKLEEAMTKVRSKEEKNAKGNQVEVEEAMIKVKSKKKNVKGNQVGVPSARCD